MGKPSEPVDVKEEKWDIPEIRYERFVQSICGDNWRDCGEAEVNGAMGVAIIRSLMDGVEDDIEVVAYHLGLPKFMLTPAYNNLDTVGVFQPRPDPTGKVIKTRLGWDRKALINKDIETWCWYSAYASVLER
jgi:hypothetical protein